MKIGAMLNSFRKSTFAENLEAAASLGIDGVQFYVSDDLPDETVKDYLTRIKDKGMVFSALCGDIGGYDDPKANEEKVAPMEAAWSAIALQALCMTSYFAGFSEGSGTLPMWVVTMPHSSLRERFKIRLKRSTFSSFALGSS